MNYSISGKQLVFLLTITFIIACTSVDDSLLTIIIFWGSILFLQFFFSLVNRFFLSQAPFSSAFKKQHQVQEFISESDCEASRNQETFESVQLLFSGTPENFYTSPKLWDRSASSSENRLCSNPPIQEDSDSSNEESEKDQLQENKCFKAPKILYIVTAKNDDDVRQNKKTTVAQDGLEEYTEVDDDQVEEYVKILAKKWVTENDDDEVGFGIVPKVATKKFVPSWARKMAGTMVLPLELQQELGSFLLPWMPSQVDDDMATHDDDVSNTTSFVQQKQGKRKKLIKVKALEAAKGAYHREQEKEMERKLKKERFKIALERAKKINERELKISEKKKQEEMKKREERRQQRAEFVSETRNRKTKKGNGNGCQVSRSQSKKKCARRTHSDSDSDSHEDDDDFDVGRMGIISLDLNVNPMELVEDGLKVLSEKRKADQSKLKPKYRATWTHRRVMLLLRTAASPSIPIFKKEMVKICQNQMTTFKLQHQRKYLMMIQFSFLLLCNQTIIQLHLVLEESRGTTC